MEEFKGFGLKTQDPNVTENRKFYVGGSDVPTILGINQYKSQFQLAKEKIGIEKAEFVSNPYVQFGNVLEPQIRDYINAVNDTRFRVGSFKDEDKRIRSNVDGYDPDEGLLLEIKTHGKNPTMEVYKAQMQLYMHQIGIYEGWLALYERPENFDIEFDADRLQIIQVEADSEYQARILDAIETFWIRCEYLKDNPEMTETEFMTFGTPMHVAVAKLNKIGPRIVEQKALMKHLEAQEKELKDYLYQQMEDNDVKKIETPSLIVTRVLPSKARRFDTKSFKEDYPELHDEYSKESERKGYVKLTERKE